MDAGALADPGGAEFVSRRRLLRIAGGLGLATTVGACAPKTPASPAPNPGASPPLNPGPTTTTPPSPTTRGIATSALLLCRDAWGARPALPGGRPHTITRMTLHHSAVVLGANRNAPGRIRADQRYHQDHQGWIDIAYHVGVDRDGNIYQLRSTEIAGDTATDYNTTGHFLVLCEGNFDEETVPEAQLHGAAVAFAWAAQTFHVAANTLAGHRDLAQTSCPGAHLYSPVASGELQGRIDALLAAGAVDLREFCGPEAAEKVAAIEAGN